MKIHSYPWRSYLDSATERVWIQIVVIQCSAARKAGLQYTKRLLPDFLLPHSPIRMDLVLEAGRRRREEKASLEDCSLVMGCLELRTVRKHLNNLEITAALSVLDLTGELSHTPQYARLPEAAPDQCAVMRLYTVHGIYLRAAAAAGRPAIPLRQILLTHWWKLARGSPTSCVSSIACPS